MQRLPTTVLLGAALVAAGVGTLQWVIATAPEPASAPSRDLAPVPVEVLELRLSSAVRSVTAYGTLQPIRTASIAPEIAGRLVRVWPDWRSGAEVAEGVELFAVDTRELEAELARIDAQGAQAAAQKQAAALAAESARESLRLGRERLAALEREEARWSGLLEQGHARESRLDGARAARAAVAGLVQDIIEREQRALSDVTVAEGRLRELAAATELARARLDKAAVRAPFRGRVVGPAPAVGATLRAGEPLVEVLDVSTLRLVLAVPEEDLPGVRLGQAVRVRVPARPELDLAGRVAALGARADPATRSVDVEVDVTNDVGQATDGDGILPPLAAGQFALAEIAVGELRDVLIVERAHFTHRRGRPVAFVAVRARPEGVPGRASGVGAEVGLDGEAGPGLMAQERALELGRAVGEGRLVLGGLEPGELLIVSPLRYLSQGAPVVRAPAAPADSGTAGGAGAGGGRH